MGRQAGQRCPPAPGPPALTAHCWPLLTGPGLAAVLGVGLGLGLLAPAAAALVLLLHCRAWRLLAPAKPPGECPPPPKAPGECLLCPA